MAGTFDFCPNSRVIKEMAPEEGSAISFNGWEFTSKPSTPYRRSFRCTLYGMKWYFNEAGNALDLNTDPQHNAGRLLWFYRQNRTWDVFAINHQYLGNLVVRFKTPVDVPEGVVNSHGEIPPFDVNLIHYNPGYNT